MELDIKEQEKHLLNHKTLFGVAYNEILHRIDKFDGRDFFLDELGDDVHELFAHGCASKRGYKKLREATEREIGGPYEGRGKNFRWKFYLPKDKRDQREIQKLKKENESLKKKVQEVEGKVKDKQDIIKLLEQEVESATERLAQTSLSSRVEEGEGLGKG